MATPDASVLDSKSGTILGKILNHPANDTIARINKILGTTAGVDSTLLLVGYSMTLVSAQLTKVLEKNLKNVTEKVADTASKALLPGETVIAMFPVSTTVERVTNMRDGAKVLSASCSDVRAFLRLFGLLRMAAMARATYNTPPKDKIIHALTWAKLAGISGYYALEHGFYLGTKGFYKGWKPEDVAKWFRVGIFSYSFYLACDYLSLWRQAQLQRENASEKVDAAKKANDDRLWWKTLQVDAAYTPLCFHWATPGGLFSDSWVGFLGACAGYASVKDAWIQAGN